MDAVSVEQRRDPRSRRRGDQTCRASDSHGPKGPRKPAKRWQEKTRKNEEEEIRDRRGGRPPATLENSFARIVKRLLPVRLARGGSSQTRNCIKSLSADGGDASKKSRVCTSGRRKREEEQVATGLLVRRDRSRNEPTWKRIARVWRTRAS